MGNLIEQVAARLDLPAPAVEAEEGREHKRVAAEEAELDDVGVEGAAVRGPAAGPAGLEKGRVGVSVGRRG